MVVGLAGIAISLAATAFSSTRVTAPRVLVVAGLLTVHLAATVTYYFYALDNSADTSTYYFDRYRIAQEAFALGTVFTVEMTQVLKIWFGASYFECFLFFQSIGFWGIVLLMRSFEEIQSKLNAPQHVVPTMILFLPSIHFWTSSIGKDAPLFFAVSLAVWSVLNLRNRLVPLAIALLVMVLFRPHIALVTVVALAAAAVLHPNLPFGRKALLFSVSLVGAVMLAQSVRETLEVDVSSATAVVAFLADTESIGGGSDLRQASFVVRLSSLLFRPFFFDATDVFGFVASVENVFSAALFIYFARNIARLNQLRRKVFFIEFCLIFSIILIILLTLVYYNVGLGLRQRIMFFPPLLCTFVAMWVMPSAALQRARTALHAQPRRALRPGLAARGAMP